MTSMMAREAAEAADAVRRQIAQSGAAFARLGERLRAAPPAQVATCARGSSDHACTYGKHLVETLLGRPVASLGPSVASVYGRPLVMPGGLLLVVSQSGRSPDLLRLAEAARAGGVLVVGFVNDPDSPLAARCEVAIPLAAGPELSVAATKSCLTAMAAFLQLTAHWSGDLALMREVAALPAALEAAAALDWLPMLATLGTAGRFVLGRGPGFGIAAEMALKWKETCRIHAEAFSTAEVLHGPVELVRSGFPVLALLQSDAAELQAKAVLDRILTLRGRLLVAGAGPAGAVALPVVPGLPSRIAPVAALQSFYGAIPRLASGLGLDPDAPANLLKVTRTV
ncbi:SIS domain-containing protein [Roseomonas haemaphysalidis]|uniref:SIS domain-containing protein n=1 Tax=Roseomonas haemaphysalidis TaxID=2768162 RepID=A0ABS3KVX6_9PROT|nr:SIS domain-containing protein [Roseomonas haemaphysalidis]MBO1081631.1 SIS domain-containing protein [Roseomonas haemaphysalidis]